jgi:hypothetical protein
VTAAHRVEDRRLLGGLDPFGDDGQPQACGHLHDRLDDRRVVAVAAEVGDEAAVDLQGLSRWRDAGRPGRWRGCRAARSSRRSSAFAPGPGRA